MTSKFRELVAENGDVDLSRTESYTLAISINSMTSMEETDVDEIPSTLQSLSSINAVSVNGSKTSSSASSTAEDPLEIQDLYDKLYMPFS